MPGFLLEFFSEEIPARMQKRAEEDLARLFAEEMKGAWLTDFPMRTLSGPRRIALQIDDLPAQTPDTRQARKGPRVGAAQQAIDGFLKATGLAKIEDADIEEEKGAQFYVARTVRKGLRTADVIAQIVPKIARAFPWPKSMRSGTSDFVWVRPLHEVLCVFDGAPVAFEIGGVKSGGQTWGHRFHSTGAIGVKSASEYEEKLRAAFVLVDREKRKAKILREAQAACAARGLALVEDQGLLEEVAGLSEWPVVVLGDMDPAFLDLPAEVIRLTMRTHQRYFAVRDAAGKLAPHFVTVANVEAKDGGAAIAAGNARVLSARLNDARFFWDADRKIRLEDRVPKLDQIVFHQKLGSVGDKVRRVEALARELAPIVGADPELAARAARLAKADLVTDVVGEFPELQGQIGRQLYLLENGLAADAALTPILPLDGGGGREAAGGGDPSIASKSSARGAPPQSALRADSSPMPDLHRKSGQSGLPETRRVSGEGEQGVVSVAIAIEDHYRPLGPNDRVPTDPVAIAVALADKLDTLVGFWAIDEKPTGSRDPYALRRAALGIVRIVLSSETRLRAPSPQRGEGREGGRADNVATSSSRPPPPAPSPDGGGESLSIFLARCQAIHRDPRRGGSARVSQHPIGADVTGELRARDDSHLRDLLAFLADRLKVQLREHGKRHDLVDAIFALGDDDLVRIVARVEALEAFLKTEDGANLLAGYKRAANILAAEEKKGRAVPPAIAARGYDAAVLAAHPEPSEQALHDALARVGAEARKKVEDEKFEGAMAALAGLRAPVDRFFDDVLVNAEDAAVRHNRLLLLADIRETLRTVADFSKIEG